jgi:hypothetical protein
MNGKRILSSANMEELFDALKRLREEVQWKAGKDIEHLNKRRRMGHLAQKATLAEYVKIISELVHNGQNVVYLYAVREEHYYAVSGVIQDRVWLVIFGSKGLMETAFPPIDPEDYLERRGFVLLGRIEEVLRWKESES